jgi:DNA-binding IclR family transcriptional regulator
MSIRRGHSIACWRISLFSGNLSKRDLAITTRTVLMTAHNASMHARGFHIRENEKRATTSKEDDGGSSVVGKVSALLWAMSESMTPQTVHQIAAKAGLPPSTTHRLLAQLKQEGLAVQTADRRYQPGNNLIALGSLVASRSQALDSIRAAIEAIVRRTGKACLFSLYVPHRLGRMLVADVRSPQTPVNFVFREHRDLIWGSTGRVILAFLSDREIADAIRLAPRSPVDGRRPPEPAALVPALSRIRASRYAISSGEVHRNGTALAVPLFGADRRIVGSIAVTEDNCRWDEAAERQLAGILMESSGRAAAALG